MSEIDFREVRKFADENKDIDRQANVVLQPAGVESLCFQFSALPTYENILANEALKLIQIVEPRHVIIQNADAVNCSQWWKELKNQLDDKLRHVYFGITGIRDSLKLNMDVLTPVVQEIVAMLASKKPIQFNITAEEDGLRISSVRQKKVFGPKVTHTFEFKLVGDWDWRYTYANLLADVLPDQFCNLRKVNLVFAFSCRTCVKRLFEKMNWTYTEKQKQSCECLKAVKNKCGFDRYSPRMEKHNDFKLAATNTKIYYFFDSRKNNVC